MHTDIGQASVEDAPVETTELEVEPRDPRASRERSWRNWMMVGLGLTALLSVLAVIIAVNALVTTNPHSTTIAGHSAGSMATSMGGTMAMGQSGSSGQGSGSTAVGKPESVKLVVRSDTEHGRRGPDGKWHDAFLPGDFTVHAGDTVTVTVTNYDNMMHSFTSSSLSSGQLINQMIPAGSAGSPSTTTFRFKAPSTPGKYAWWCAVPCDPWAMAHDGYMRGYVTVAA
jgi:plastocyanin